MTFRLPVDPVNMPSAHLTSRPLRQVMYGLLLGRGTQLHVDEFDRDGQHMKFIPVQPTFKGVAKQLKLDSLDKVKILRLLSKQITTSVTFITDDR